MRKRVAIGMLIVGSLIAASCSGSSESNAPPLTAQQACADAAAAFCQALDKCASALVGLAYGDVTTCASRIVLGCVSSLGAPGTSANADSLEACSLAIPSASCNELLDHDTPDACETAPGSEVNGTACLDGAQCQSAYCNRSGADCGACAAAPKTGSACKQDNDCPHGDKCSTSGVCAVPVADGAACSDATVCAAPDACINGKCGPAGQAGAPCTAGECDLLHGFACDPATHQCVAFTLAGAGQPCGLINGALALCAASGNCKIAAGTGQGVCEAAAEDGAACDATAGPRCMPPASCVGALCRLPPTSCP